MEKVNKVINRLMVLYPDISRDTIDFLRNDIMYYRKDWEYLDLIRFYQCMEEVNPSVPENVALDIMRSISKKYS